MSDLHEAVSNYLQRRRELARMPKPELINRIRQLETGIEQLTARIDAYRNEP